MRKRMTLLALTAVLALSAGGCAPRREGSVGILYRVTGGKNSLVLLGSIHVGSEEMYPMGSHILDALEEGEDHSYFVTLGLLHLVLPGDSVPDGLEAMGYTVERILPENV